MKYIFLVIAMLISLTASGKDVVTWQEVGESKTEVNINWCRKIYDVHSACSKNKGENIRGKIDSKTEVSIRLSSFNFIKYNAKFDIQEKEIKVYSFLSNVWDEVLNINLQTAIGTSGSSSESALITWWKEIEQKNIHLQEILNNYDKEYLTKTKLIRLKNDINDVIVDIDEINSTKQNAYNSIKNDFKLIEVYNSINKAHVKYFKAANSFKNLGNLSLKGKLDSIGKKKAGTIVTAKVKAISQGEDGLPTSSEEQVIEYPVESIYPLEFHVGFTVAQLEDQKFSTLRALDGRELFTRVRDDKNTSNFSAYLSYKFTDSWLATIGTDIEKPGNNMYLGVSKKFGDKWYLSLGGTYGKTLSAEGEVQEMNANGNTRILYELIKEDRDWGSFFSISYKTF